MTELELNFTVESKSGNDCSIVATIEYDYYPDEYDDFGQGRVCYAGATYEWDVKELELQLKHYKTGKWSYKKLDYKKMSDELKAKINKEIEYKLEDIDHD